MSPPIETPAIGMEHLGIPGTPLTPSRIALGTWAIGGWMWGGTDQAEAIRTIQAAVDRGITLIDTAPVYGFGRSEEIVGKALAQGGRRDRVVIATKVGLDWKDGLQCPSPRPRIGSGQPRDATKNGWGRSLAAYRWHSSSSPS
jgi:aryl-alcohol dehydrogenase-like predicted oxidoreductase